MRSTIGQVLDELTKRAERHPQATGTLYRVCYNHHDAQNVPCDQARAMAWLYKMTDHESRACDTCNGFGWKWGPDTPEGRASFEKRPCPNCGGSGLEHVRLSVDAAKEES